MRKIGMLSSVWSMDGKICDKSLLEGAAQRIHSQEEPSMTNYDNKLA